MTFPTALIGLIGCTAVVAAPFLYTAFAPPVVTRVGFEALRAGMDEAACAQTIGHPGRETLYEVGAQGTRRMLVWMNADGSTVTATFERGALVSKVAERLR